MNLTFKMKRGSSYVLTEAMEYAFLAIIAIMLLMVGANKLDEEVINEIKANKVALALSAAQVVKGDLRAEVDIKGNVWVDEGKVSVYKSKVGKSKEVDFISKTNNENLPEIKVEKLTIFKKDGEIAVR